MISGSRELFDVEAVARSPNHIPNPAHVGRVGEASGFRAHESAEYVRREPEKTLLYQTVQQHWLQCLADVEAEGGELPAFVKDELEAFLRCGVLAHGFLRVRCKACGHSRVVGFSCKRRGSCPSCLGRRMADTAAFCVDHLFPEVPFRQPVLSVPVHLRFRKLLVGQETIKVAAGSFKTSHYRNKTEQGTVDMWVSEEAPPTGMVKMTTSAMQAGAQPIPPMAMELAAMGKSAKATITKKPKPFDPQMMMGSAAPAGSSKKKGKK